MAYQRAPVHAVADFVLRLCGSGCIAVLKPGRPDGHPDQSARGAFGPKAASHADSRHSPHRAQKRSISSLMTARLERQKSALRTSMPTLAATSATVPEPQERSS